ncbi:flagellar hook-length control protein FliK [Clostridium cylindrosporum]|uniref:Flagellar hook-length control protein FliK n=1 Tax=Clostridium cylindrosporum DSM 605 TaxID=1121307 RepID=A0A0J8DBL5_CLOCY|nr:flagellar hook-length control protein FliK [Clostridium cylindrosporum]KMT21704.1 flagellar hook-length control protein FliK [Clostridium cylindrosporum DSM 605]
MNVPITITSEAMNIASMNNSSARELSNGTDFLNLLTSLLTSGAEGENALISLLNSKEVTPQDTSTTLGSIMNTLNLRINGESTPLKKDNFIIGQGDMEDILDNLKNLSKNIAEESLSQYINGINQDNGFLKLRAMESLNFQAQNSSLASTIQGMITNLSGNVENKEVLNALKFLQQFTNSDGSLDTSKLLKAIEAGGKGQDASSFMNSMNLNQGGTSQIQESVPVKEVNIFNTRDIVDVVVENFKTLRLPGRCEMRIKLNPQELGEITIKLVLEKGQVSAVISSDRKDTFALLQSNINNLLQQLKDSGTELHHVAVNLSQDQSGEEARRGYKGEKEKSQDEEFEDVFEETANKESSTIL